MARSIHVCPACDSPLQQVDDSGHYHYPDCDWTGIIDD